VHEDWLSRLEDQGLVDRHLEFLPGSEELAERRAAGQGLTAPELAVLLAYTKIVLEGEIARSELPDDPYLLRDLVDYFPQPLRERYAEQMRTHRLHREIITTVAVNRFVDTAGITCFHRLSVETGATAADVLLAHTAARTVFRAAELDEAVRALDHRVDAQTQTLLRLEVRTLVERATRWLLNRRRRVDIQGVVDELAEGVRVTVEALPSLLPGREREAWDRAVERYRGVGVPEDLARVVAALPPAYAALSVVQTAQREGHAPLLVAGVHFALGQRLGLDRLLGRILELPRTDRWRTMARAALRDDLHGVHAGLTAQALALLPDEAGHDAAALVETWERSVPGVLDVVRTLETICAAPADLARVSVGLRVVRGLLPSLA
jgi:glutamate dehydrogenase